MSTPDQWQKRAAENLRSRHVETARQAAKHIQEYAGYVLRDLAAGRVPHYGFVDDAVELSRRVEALNALRELTAIYETTDED